MPRSFRFHGRNLAITWPQCETTKETVLERILVAFPSCKAVVSEEEHADGAPHLHAALLFAEETRINGFRTLDALAGKHGDYKPAPTPRNWIKYVIKVS